MSKYKSIIILGPTSSGKTDLANFIATYNGYVINCDAIQIYRGLNSLTNKPVFLKQEYKTNEFVSYTKPTPLLVFAKWHDFKFKFISKTGKDFKCIDKEYMEVLDYLISEELVFDDLNKQKEEVENYLFDIKEPIETYSLANFRSDIERVRKLKNGSLQITAGGTIYYAYHHIFGTVFDSEFEEYRTVKDLRAEVSKLNLADLIKELEEKDSAAINLIDLNNKQRVAKAVEYIRRSGKKFSDNYFKEMNVLNDFLLIIIEPKDREVYYKKLDGIVENRMNLIALEEVSRLIKIYGDEVKPWLSSLSYEYKYALKILEYTERQSSQLKSSEIQSLMSGLKLAERHYAKRQITFLKKLEKDLLK
jgi:tRNA dimethylallyltransferase